MKALDYSRAVQAGGGHHGHHGAITVVTTVVIIELATVDICVVRQADRDLPGPLCYFIFLVRTRPRT